MLSISLNVDWESLAKDEADLVALPNRFVQNVLARTSAKLKQAAPATTGQLEIAGRHEMTGYAQGRVIFDTNYASFVHDGRGAGGVDFYAIKDWVKSKGLAPESAWPIAQSIKKKGTQKQPWANNFIDSVRMRQLVNAVIQQEARRVA